MFLCEKCNAEFEQTPAGKQQWLMHRAKHTSSAGIPVETKSDEPKVKSLSASEIKAMKATEEKPKPKALKLVYHWDGQCPDCGKVVDTLDIEAGQPKGKTVIIAYCSGCRKQLSYRPVEKL